MAIYNELSVAYAEHSCFNGDRLLRLAFAATEQGGKAVLKRLMRALKGRQQTGFDVSAWPW